MSPYMAKGLCWCDSTQDLVVKRVFWKHPEALNRMTRVPIREKQWEKWRRQCSNQEAGLTEGRSKGMWQRCRALLTPYHRWLLPRSLQSLKTKEEGSDWKGKDSDFPHLSCLKELWSGHSTLALWDSRTAHLSEGLNCSPFLQLLHKNNTASPGTLFYFRLAIALSHLSPCKRRWHTGYACHLR